MLETKNNLKDDTVEGLKKIVKMNIDASKGFAEVADKIEDPSLASTFRSASTQRAGFASELKGALSLNDEEIPEDGTTLGSFHRSWIDLRAALNGGDTKAMLTEASRGESSLVDTYESVLEDTAGSPLNATLHDQLTSVCSMRRSLDALKEKCD